MDPAGPVGDVVPAAQRGRWDTRIWALFALFLVLRLALAVSVPLTYKEAYYWEWSKFLAPGYLDHPPLVALLVAASTRCLGDTLLGVRLPALVLGTLSLLLVRQLSWLLFRDRALADRALLVAHGVPVLQLTGVVMFPDAALVCAYLAAACCFLQALRTRGTGWWLATGAALGIALESKLMAIPGVCGMALFVLLDPEARARSKGLGPWLALAVAAAIFAPYLWWNQQHEWLGLWTQGWDRHRIETQPLAMLLRAGEMLFVEQLAAGGILAIPLWCAVLLRARDLDPERQRGLLFLRCLALSTFLLFLAAGTVTETHPHWTVLGYPAAAIALAALPARTGMRWMWRSPRVQRLSLWMLLLVFLGAVLALGTLTRADPQWLGEDLGEDLAEAQQQLFWLREIRGALDEIEVPAAGTAPVLFGFGSKRTALLAWYGGKADVVDLRSHLRVRKKVGESQFLYRTADSLDGASGLFISDTRWIRGGHLLRLFDSVRPLPPIEIHTGARRVRRMNVWHVEHFHPERIADIVVDREWRAYRRDIWTEPLSL